MLRNIKNNENRMNERLDYIDRMKGLAIFLVVLGHVYYMIYDKMDCVYSDIIGSFNMPLFMFLSGLVAASCIIGDGWSRVKLFKKIKALLVPFFFFGICCSFMFFSNNRTTTVIVDFFNSPAKNGYWYLMSLSVFYLLLFVYKLNSQQKWQFDIGIALGLWGAIFIMEILS